VRQDDAVPDRNDLALFGVVGLDRGRGGGGGIASVIEGRRHRTVYTSQSLGYDAADGCSITITSHRRVDDQGYASIRTWAPMNPYLATPRGLAALELRHEPGDRLERVEVDWEPVTIRVDGQPTAFEMCDIDHGWWAAVGRLAEAIITIDSRGVPLAAVHLERVAKHPVPALPDVADQTAAITHDLDTRFERVPFRRVRGMADYWALRAVEVDHVHRLAHRLGLSDQDRQAIEGHWLARIEARVAPTMERLHFKDMDAARNSRIARHLRGRNFLHQVWSNTVGPGAKCWVGNRYTPIRHHTFRLRWRP
jgi:hypothetical protein